mmetsp:Transcript_23380/g.52738  ORF Transcript_23380/g.52738 Transcript_23380/m.52738 type:complete len:303 (-) Transcript_23380:272-1180(-)|eukprot:CAMPEP_0172588262 /NCGR_PEP_ID=MMETSP1068-20121228/7189_1 /TAXON_ID=35684 /ORGANISM="Pseudopedinella elastica, Strain CCMP716" /LENGTH=302 /DNA_ID=CAMNT_0013383539 /DNA_START=73 /DNA_END=981 /DNA_ORIENTATION=+
MATPRAFISFSVLGAAVVASEVHRKGFHAFAAALSLQPCIVVKMGGSAITIKNKLETLNEKALDTTARQIADAARQGTKLAVLHGAGSFGHFQAKKYLISKGDSHPDWAFGFADTRRAVTTLNIEVVSRLVKARVPAVGLSPFPCAVTSGKKLSLAGPLAQAKEVLDKGFVPVLHGDAVFDDRQGSAIVSGDLILDTLCQGLSPTAAVFLTDVPGVFTKPPSESGAQLIPEILVGPDGSCSLPEMSTAEHDVTGGIEEKLKTAIAVVVKCGIPVYIVQVGTEHAGDALAGKVPKVATVLRRA